MSLNTRCPACETVFKVVPDQLKVSSGWVRCGRCAEVFDARAQMLTSISAQAKPATASLPVAAPVSVAAKTPEASVDAVPELSFVRHAKNKAFWQHPNVVRSLLALLMALTGLLAFQVVLHQRNELAAMHPGLQSGLESFCQAMGCVIEPVKQLEALKIESSSFQKMQESAQGDTYALKVTLKSSAAQPLAVPALELTLTDTNDNPVLRRVLLANELGFQGKTLAPLGEWHAALSMVVAANQGPNLARAPITGYRVLAFYP